MKLTFRSLLLTYIGVFAFLAASHPYFARIAYAQDLIAEVNMTASGRAAGTQDFKSLISPKASIILNSSDLADMFDIPSPPAPPDDRTYINMFFLIGAERFMRDARPPKTEHQFTLRTLLMNYESPINATLSWDLRLPSNYSAKLTDTQTNSIVDLRLQQNYSYNLTPGAGRNFILVLSASTVASTPAATAASTLITSSPTPAITSTPTSTPPSAPTPVPITTSPPLLAPAPMAAVAPSPIPASMATPMPLTKPAAGTAPQPSITAPGASPSAVIPDPATAPDYPAITPAPEKLLPDPTRFTVAHSEIIPDRTYVPVLPDEQKKSFRHGFIAVLISAASVAAAAAYVLSRFIRNKASGK